MIIKISRSEKPFWGVGKVYLDFLNEHEINYFLVLLESDKSGHVFDRKEIERMIQSKEELSVDIAKQCSAVRI